MHKEAIVYPPSQSQEVSDEQSLGPVVSNLCLILSILSALGSSPFLTMFLRLVFDCNNINMTVTPNFH